MSLLKMQKITGSLVALVATVATLSVVTAPSFAAEGGLEDSLVISIRGGATEAAFKQINPLFEKATGVKVTNVVNTSGPAYAALRASTKNPPIDILQTVISTQVQGKIDGVFVKNDPAVVTNIGNLDPQFVDPDGYGVPFGITIAGIEYNTDVYKANNIPEPTSWNDLFDPAVKGHLAISTMPITFGQDLIVALSRSNGTTEKTPDVAFQKIADQGSDLIIYKSPADLDNYFQQGAVWVAMNGLPNYLALKASGMPVKMVYPKEGPVSVGPVLMTAVANASHPKAAQAFLNFLLTPEAQKIFASAALVPTTTNADLPPEISANLPTAEQMKQLITPDFEYINSVLDQWVQRANKDFGR